MISVLIHAGIDDIQKVKRKYYNAKIVYRYTKSFTDNPEILSEHALRVPPTSEISMENLVTTYVRMYQTYVNLIWLSVDVYIVHARV